jgi:beta-galactosidase
MSDFVGIHPWNDPEIVGYRREPVSTLRRAFGPDSLDLDGPWRFQLLPSPSSSVSAQAWSTATVPGCWTTEPAEAAAGAQHGMGPDLPWYTNFQMPWPNLPPVPPPDNPTGVYERAVEVPAGWAGRRTLLHVGAAESMLIVHVDGVCVGISTDSHLGAEFDLSHVVQPGRSATVRLTVPKWSASSFVEDQDQWWHGGVTRSVRLFSRPRLHLSDVRIEASASGRLAVDVRVGSDGGRLPADWRVAVRLERPEAEGGSLDLSFDAQAHARDVEDERVSVYRGRVRFRADVPRVRQWSAEVPDRYQLTVELRDREGDIVESSTHRVGFRTVEIVGPDLLLNGRRVFLRGVNRHDWNPLTGRVVTAADIRTDLVTLKRFGFNAVRTSHYPNDPAFLELCDELGFYVVDEADIESHAYAIELCDDPAYLPAFTQRVARMVRRDRNHPSVIVWSLGNESDYGANHDAVAAWVRRDDRTRPVQYEGAIKDDWDGGQAASDIVCPMYASVDDLLAHVTAAPPTRPVILCEYSHAMGNSNGSLADYWAAIESQPGLQGGFIWELFDHGILQRTADGLPAGRSGTGGFRDGVPAPGYRWAHGGDFGDTPNDGCFCLDGLLLPDGTPKPAMFEHRELAAPLRIRWVEASGNRVRVRLRNHQDVRDLSWLAGTWQCFGADGTVLEAPAALPALGPGEEADIEVPVAVLDGPSDVEPSLVLHVVTAAATAWAPEGTTVCLPGVVLTDDLLDRDLGDRPQPTAAVVGGASKALDEWHIDGDGRLVLPGLVEGPQLALWRAPTDNDRLGGHAERWARLGLDTVKPELVEVQDKQTQDGEHVARVVTRWPTAAGDVRHEQRFGPWEWVGGGRALRCEERVIVPDGLEDLPRIGIILQASDDSSRLTWFGHGPWETYPDRCTAPIGRWAAAVDELATPYATGQETGGRHGARWLRLDSGNGSGRPGLSLSFDRPLQVSVSPSTAHAVAASRSGRDPARAGGLVVQLDVAHRGLGTASCGPDTRPGYRTGPGVFSWTWWLRTW